MWEIMKHTMFIQTECAILHFMVLFHPQHFPSDSEIIAIGSSGYVDQSKVIQSLYSAVIDYSLH